MPDEGKHGDSGRKQRSADSNRPTARRRAVLTSIGATAAAGLAGCSGESPDSSGGTDTGGDGGSNGGSDDGDSTSTTAGSVQETDTVFRVYNTADSDLTAAEVNKLNPRFNWPWAFWFYNMGMRASLVHGESYMEGYESVNYDPESREYTINIRDNIFWHQGAEIKDEFTSEDILWDYRINSHPDIVNNPKPGVEEVTAPDDKTVVVKMSDGVHTQAIQKGVPIHSAHAGSYTYRNGEIVSTFKEFKKASGSERTKLKEQIISHKMPTDGTAITCGPWYVENASKQQLDLRRVPGHFLTDNPDWNNNWSRAQIKKVTGSGNVQQQGLNRDRIDYAFGGPPSNVSVSALPDHVTTRLKEGKQGRGLQISFRGEVNDTLRVPQGEAATTDIAKLRQGIAYAMDSKACVRNRLGKRVEEVMPWFERTHFGEGDMIKQYYPDLWEQLPSYGPDPMPEKAKEAFRQGGLTEQNGTWMTPDGKEFELEIQVWSNNPGIAVTAESNLKAVGINAAVKSMDPTKFVNNIFEGSFGVVPSYVYTAYNVPDVESIEMLSAETPGWAWKQHSPPGRYELPEIGDMGTEPAETFNATEAEESIKTSGMEDHAELGKKAIWAASYYLPNIPLYRGLDLNRYNETHFNWPGKDEKFYTVTEDEPIAAGTKGRFAIRGTPNQVAKTE
jgi:ABC-type oligopeptide transport system substrate-binding subunit